MGLRETLPGMDSDRRAERWLSYVVYGFLGLFLLSLIITLGSPDERPESENVSPINETDPQPGENYSDNSTTNASSSEQLNSSQEDYNGSEIDQLIRRRVMELEKAGFWATKGEYIKYIKGIEVEKNLGEEYNVSDFNSSKLRVVHVNVSVGHTFGADYTVFSGASTSIYERTFSSYEGIVAVSVRVWKEKEDEYGNLQEHYLGYSLMSRDTYERINWDQFDPVDLNDVTTVDFQGRNPISGREAY